MKYFFNKPKLGYNDISLDSKHEAVYKSYKQSAVTRGYSFHMSRNHFIHVIKSNCYYCSNPPSEYKDGTVRNGVDRINNDKGYSTENVIACCKTCNVMKSTATYAEFVQHTQKITDTINTHTKIRNFMHYDSLEFKAYIFKYGRYLSPNELLECLKLNLLLKSDIIYDFKIALSEFPKEYEIVKKQLRGIIPKYSLKNFCRLSYFTQQLNEWNFYK